LVWQAPQLDSLMEHTRLKNVAICKRRLPQIAPEDLIANINALDGSSIGLDAIGISSSLTLIHPSIFGVTSQLLEAKLLQEHTSIRRNEINVYFSIFMCSRCTIYSQNLLKTNISMVFLVFKL
jgi:hypothetical protein